MFRKNVLILIITGLVLSLSMGISFVYAQVNDEVKITTYYPVPYARYGTIEVLDFAQGDDSSTDPISGTLPDWRVDGMNVDYLDGFSAEDFAFKYAFDDWLSTDCCWADSIEWIPPFPSGIFTPHCPSGYYVSAISRTGIDANAFFVIKCCKFTTTATEPSWLPSVCTP